MKEKLQYEIAEIKKTIDERREKKHKMVRDAFQLQDN